MGRNAARDYHDALRWEFSLFAERCFRHLNPGVAFVEGVAHRRARDLAVHPAIRTRQRTIINLPPRHLKSLLGSIALPAWLLGHNPSLQIICASYGAELAHKLPRDCRTIMESDFYKACSRARAWTGMRLAS